MRRHALHEYLAANGNPFWQEEKLHHSPEDYCVWNASSHPRRLRTPTSYTAAPAPAAAPPPAEGAPADAAGDKKDEAASGDDEGAPKLEYMMENGKTIQLCGKDQDCCIQSCKNAPEFKDDNEGSSGMDKALNASVGGEQGMVASCTSYCDTEFRLQCFPGSSTVVTRDRGRIPLSKLRTGDEILVAITDKGEAVSLAYEPVISWLHHQPEIEMEVVEVKHAQGAVSLTPDHMIFRRSADNNILEAVAAQDMCEGDRVLSPWIDGNLNEPKVTSVSVGTASGAYAPLTPSGTLLVDGTVVSCYIAPEDLAESPAYAKFLRGLNAVAGRNYVHEFAHFTMLPVRVLHMTTAQFQKFGPKPEEAKAKAAEDFSTLKNKELTTPSQQGIHPYGEFLYVMFKAFAM